MTELIKTALDNGGYSNCYLQVEVEKTDIISLGPDTMIGITKDSVVPFYKGACEPYPTDITNPEFDPQATINEVIQFLKHMRQI